MKLIKKTLLAGLGLILIFIIYLLFNTFNFKSTQLKYEPATAFKINRASIENFSKAIKIKTVSPENAIDFDSLQFQNFETFLMETYPLVDSILEKKTFNSFSYLYKWPGSDPSLKPIILMAHLDLLVAHQ